MKKALLIFIAILLGGLFNFGHAYTYIIRYNLMVMLFFAFLSVPFHFQLFQKEHFKVLGINLILPIILYFFLRNFDTDLSLIAFILCVSPTAAAAPVIANIMKADVGIATISTLLTTPIVALILPFYLINILNVGESISTKDVVLPIVSLIFLPLLLSQLSRIGLPQLSERIKPLGAIAFPLFLINVFIACGNASYFIQNSADFRLNTLLQILALVGIVCLLQFQIGHYIGRHIDRISYGLAMGRKNTIIGLWVAITYFSPLIALGPIAYIIAHNIYNSVQMMRTAKINK